MFKHIEITEILKAFLITNLILRVLNNRSLDKIFEFSKVILISLSCIILKNALKWINLTLLLINVYRINQTNFLALILKSCKLLVLKLNGLALYIMINCWSLLNLNIHVLLFQVRSQAHASQIYFDRLINNFFLLFLRVLDFTGAIN